MQVSRSADAAEHYLQKFAASLQSALPADREVTWHTVTGPRRSTCAQAAPPR